MDSFDDLLNLTDTSSSSSSSNPKIFEVNRPFVLELHDIVKDEPTTESTAPVGKIKKKKKKKSQQETEMRSSSSSSVLSDSVPRVTDTVERDEFYDADESYHELTDPETANFLAAVELAQAISEHEQEQKITSQLTESRHSSATTRQPSKTITKPALPP